MGKLKDLCWELFLQILGLLVTLLLSLYFITFVPTLITRPIARALRPYLRPDLGDILTCMGSAFAQADESSQVSNSIILTRITFTGTLNYEQMLKLVQENLINCKLEESSNQLRYPELQQYIYNWCGYKFWKWEESFSLREHVHMLTPKEGKSDQEIYKICQDLLSGSPLPEYKSPWDVTLVPINEGQSTLVFLRFHHALADGYSILNFTKRMFTMDDKELVKEENKIEAKYATINVHYMVTLPCKVLRVFGDLAYNSVTKCLWKIPQEDKSPKWNYIVGEGIPIREVLQIKRHFGVSFTAVVFSLVSGGVHNYLKKNGEQVVDMPCAIAVPVKDHPDRLMNQFSFVLTSYPVGVKDPLERLMQNHNNFENLRDSPVPLIGYFVMLLHGSHWNPVGRVLNNYKYAPMVATYFPVGFKYILKGGEIGTDLDFGVKLHQGQQGVLFCISSYNKEVKITSVVNEAILDKNEAEQLTRCITQEAQTLLALTKSDKMFN